MCDLSEPASCIFKCIIDSLKLVLIHYLYNSFILFLNTKQTMQWSFGKKERGDSKAWQLPNETSRDFWIRMLILRLEGDLVS